MVQVQFVLSRMPFCEWHRAIDCLPNTHLVFPPSTHRYGEDHYVWNNRWDRMVQTHILNERQKKAVAVIMAPKEEILPPILLLGPFGTGKTSTIAQALRIMLLDDLDSKIILCTQSNSAADLYVKEFFDVWYRESNNQRLKPLRIYYKGRTRNTVKAQSVIQLISIFKSKTLVQFPFPEIPQKNYFGLHTINEPRMLLNPSGKSSRPRVHFDGSECSFPRSYERGHR